MPELNEKDGDMETVCDVCGKRAPVRVVCSAYGPVSFGYCEDCLSKHLEPYSAVVGYIACAGRFPDEINETYRQNVRRMLPLWNKTEEEFIRDVDEAIKEMNDSVRNDKFLNGIV